MVCLVNGDLGLDLYTARLGWGDGTRRFTTCACCLLVIDVEVDADLLEIAVRTGAVMARPPRHPWPSSRALRPASRAQPPRAAKELGPRLFGLCGYDGHDSDGGGSGCSDGTKHEIGPDGHVTGIMVRNTPDAGMGGCDAENDIRKDPELTHSLIHSNELSPQAIDESGNSVLKSQISPLTRTVSGQGTPRQGARAEAQWRRCARRTGLLPDRREAVQQRVLEVPRRVRGVPEVRARAASRRPVNSKEQAIEADKKYLESVS